jgi:hypothetical protein
MKALREKCFQGFPDSIPAAMDNGSRLDMDGINELKFLTEPGIQTTSRVYGLPANVKALFVVGTKIEKDAAPRVQKDISPKGAALLYPREIDQPWSTKSPPNYVLRALALLGRTADEGRVWDVAAAARRLRGTPKKGAQPFLVGGGGQAGIIAAYAALFEPTIDEVLVIDPPKSHKDGPYFLGVLRVLDIPEALGLLAPRSLTLINAKDPAFDRTAEIYKLAGAADKLTRK